MRSTLAAVLVVLTLGCTAHAPTTVVPVRPEPSAATPETRKLQLSAPVGEWHTLRTSGFTILFPPSWRMAINKTVGVWACTGEGHTCAFRWGTAKLKATDLVEYLSDRKSTIKVGTVRIVGDDAVLWTSRDEDGDAWIDIMRFHDGAVFHLAYMGSDKIPDDFFVVLPTMQFISDTPESDAKL